MSTVHEMTRMALAESAEPRVLAAFDAIPPNRSGHPMVGLLGFLSPGDLLLVARAADLAHRQARTDGWQTQDPPEQVARHLARFGGWRNPSDKWRPVVVEAIRAYKQAIRAAS